MAFLTAAGSDLAKVGRYKYVEVVEMHNNIAMVTGEASGIGRATTKLLVAKGHRVIGNARIENRLAELVSRAGQQPDQFVAENDGAALPRAIDSVRAAFKRDEYVTNPVYGATKLAIHSAAEALRHELSSHGARLALIQPNVVKINFQEAAGYDERHSAAAQRILTPD